MINDDRSCSAFSLNLDIKMHSFRGPAYEGTST